MAVSQWEELNSKIFMCIFIHFGHFILMIFNCCSFLIMRQKLTECRTCIQNIRCLLLRNPKRIVGDLWWYKMMMFSTILSLFHSSELSVAASCYDMHLIM